MESLTKSSHLSDTEFMNFFEKILDRFGIEAVLFLKTHRASRWFKISGKRCSMRSKMNFTGLEFRIRSSAEMKKLRFDWDALNGAEESELSPHFIVPSKFKVLTGENIEKCFVKVSTKEKGEFLMALRSKGMRDATLRGLRLVLSNRAGEYDTTDDTATENPAPLAADSDDEDCSEDDSSKRKESANDVDGDESDYDQVADDIEVVNLSPNTPKRRTRAFHES